MTSARPAGAADSPGFLLWRVTLAWQREVGAALRPLGLTHVQFVLLAGVWWLGREQASPTQRELADHAGTDPMMTSQVVRALEARALVRREPDPGDARMRRLSITAAGRELLDTALPAVDHVDAAFFTPVPRGEVVLMLDRLVHRPDGDAPRPRATVRAADQAG